MRALAPLALALALATPAAGQDAAVSRALIRLQQLEAEIQRLNGRIEELEYRLDRVARDGGARFGDVDLRLTDLEGGDITALLPPRDLGGTPPRAGAAAAAPAIVDGERASFDAAVDLVRDGRPEEAIDALDSFLLSWPDSPLTSDARHWSGQALLDAGRPREAAQVFLSHHSADPTHPLAAGSLLGLARALPLIGQPAEGCRMLDEVVRRYPGYPAALAEADRLRGELGCG